MSAREQERKHKESCRPLAYKLPPLDREGALSQEEVDRLYQSIEERRAAARCPLRPPEWTDFGGSVSNVLYLPNGTVVYDIQVPRTDWLGRLLMLRRTETRIDMEEG